MQVGIVWTLFQRHFLGNYSGSDKAGSENYKYCGCWPICELPNYQKTLVLTENTKEGKVKMSGIPGHFFHIANLFLIFNQNKSTNWSVSIMTFPSS